MMVTSVLGMILLLSSVVANSLDCCSRGEMLHASKEGIENCIICPRGTFMAKECHTNRQCDKCTSVRNATLEVEITKCNGTHDAVIDCICGYYRHMSRIKDEKDECKECPACPLPGNSSSGHSRDIESTKLIGLIEDTEDRTRGTSVSTDTLHSHARNQSKKGVTDCQTIIPSDVSIYVALFVILIAILIAAFVAFIRTDKPDTEHYLSSVACSRFKTPRILIATILFVLLFVLLIICAVLTIGAIELRHDAKNVCIIITVVAAGGYVIAVIFLTRRPQKPQIGENRRPVGTVVDGHSEEIRRRQIDKLLRTQSGNKVIRLE